MKGIGTFLLAMLSIAFFAACDKSDSPEGPVTDYGHLFEHTYSMSADGCCVLEGMQPTRSTVIEDEVSGYGWKVIGVYKVQDDGRLSPTDSREVACEGGLVDYWFEPDGHLVGFRHGDAVDKPCVRTEWYYDAARGFIMRGSASQGIQGRYMQVLAVATHRGKKFYLYTMQQLPVQPDGQDGQRPSYAMVVYQRMTDRELAEVVREAASCL